MTTPAISPAGIPGCLTRVNSLISQRAEMLDRCLARIGVSNHSIVVTPQGAHTIVLHATGSTTSNLGTRSGAVRSVRCAKATLLLLARSSRRGAGSERCPRGRSRDRAVTRPPRGHGRSQLERVARARRRAALRISGLVSPGATAGAITLTMAHHWPIAMATPWLVRVDGDFRSSA
jgi:hypothetical protein